jgi:hypothetical protein
VKFGFIRYEALYLGVTAYWYVSEGSSLVLSICALVKQLCHGVEIVLPAVIAYGLDSPNKTHPKETIDNPVAFFLCTT